MANIERHFLEPSRDLFREVDLSIRTSRGPSLLPCQVLFAGLVYLGMSGSTKTVTKLERVLRNEATEGQLQVIMGTPAGPMHQHRKVEPPSRWSLYRLYGALARGFKRDGLGREIFGADTLEEALRKLSLRLLVETAPIPPLGAEFTVDTTDIWAACRPVSQGKMRSGLLASDPDARWRKKKKGELDPDSPFLKASPNTDKDANQKLVFGYGGVTVGGTHENYGYVYGFDLIPANDYDVPASLKVMDALTAGGYQIGEIIGDRGFSQAVKWCNGARSRGVMPIFDLKVGQGDRDPDWKAAWCSRAGRICLSCPSGSGHCCVRACSLPKPSGRSFAKMRRSGICMRCCLMASLLPVPPGWSRLSFAIGASGAPWCRDRCVNATPS
ncbi:MAG: hypothetical protein WB116_11725 [Candidatus Dormiibacterota bacterium]